MAELLKKDKNSRNFAKRWFWRTRQSQEIDLVHEVDGIWSAYEFKWNDKKNVSCPSAFKEAYPEVSFHVINRKNFIEFV